jgi:hypothetical protein
MSEIQNTSPSKAQRTPRKSHKVDYLLFFFFGALTIVIFIVITILECPNDAQLQFFQIILAISIGGLAAGVPGFLDVTYKDWIRAGGGLGVFVLILFLKPANLATSHKCDPFSVIAHLKTSNNDFAAFDDLDVSLLLGPYRMEPRAVKNGRVTFDHIPRDYFDDTITLLPTDTRVKVLTQNYFTASASSEIIFSLEKKRDSTSVSGFVYNADQEIMPGVELVFASNFKTVTDQSGHYTITLPYEIGEIVQLRVIMNNTIRQNHNQYVNSTIDIILD